MRDEGCVDPCVPSERAGRLVQKTVPDEVLYELAQVFRVLGDYTRVRILHLLSLGELCVCDIADVLGVSSSAVSHQLRLLRTSKLVKIRREGKKVYYSLDDEHVRHLMQEGMQHVLE